MFLLYIRYLIAFLFLSGSAIILTRPEIAGLVLAFMFIIASFLWFRRTVVEFGWDSVRGQFTAILGFSFIVQAVGCLLMEVKGTVHLTTAAFLMFMLARLMFLSANVRYTFHFLGKGYLLPAKRLMAVLIASAGVLFLILLLPNALREILKFSPYSLFVIVDMLLILSVFYNLALLWNTLITKRWIFGALVAVVLVVGDALLVARVWETAVVWMWYLAATLVSLTGTIRT